MSFAARPLVWMWFLVLPFSWALPAPTSPFRHVVVIVQENRTPDNLFGELLNWPGIDAANYEIATGGVNSKGQFVPLTPIGLGIGYDLSHAHAAFVAMYDNGRMDGADKIPCTGKCAAEPQFKYVSNADHVLDPYLTLAAAYGWANAMFQTNQGPSYPAHQFLFGGTSARGRHRRRFARFASPTRRTPNAWGASGRPTSTSSPRTYSRTSPVAAYPT